MNLMSRRQGSEAKQLKHNRHSRSSREIYYISTLGVEKMAIDCVRWKLGRICIYNIYIYYMQYIYIIYIYTYSQSLADT